MIGLNKIQEFLFCRNERTGLRAENELLRYQRDQSTRNESVARHAAKNWQSVAESYEAKCRELQSLLDDMADADLGEEFENDLSDTFPYARAVK